MQDAQSVGRSRHIARRASFLQDMHESGAVRVSWVDTARQVADILTKPLASKQFEALRAYLMNV